MDERRLAKIAARMRRLAEGKWFTEETRDGPVEVELYPGGATRSDLLKWADEIDSALAEGGDAPESAGSQCDHRPSVTRGASIGPALTPREREFFEVAKRWIEWCEPTTAPIPQMETGHGYEWIHEANARFDRMRDAYRAMLEAVEKEDSKPSGR